MNTPRGLNFVAVLMQIYFIRRLDAHDINPCRPEALPDNVVKQCGGSGYGMRCDGHPLTEVPSSYPRPDPKLGPLCVLFLNKTQLQIIRNNSFTNVSEVQFLYLSENDLTYVDTDAFTGLEQLKYLNLSNNHLRWPEGFGHGVFDPLVNLTNINIKENQFTSYDGMDKEMAALVKLEGLYIDGCSNCSFGPGFAEFQNLVNVSLSGRSKSVCKMPNVTSETVRFHPQIKNLWMANCNIQSISETAFKQLQNIELLDISYNKQLEFKGMNTALAGLQNNTSLKVLNVNRIHTLYERGTMLKEAHIKNLKTLKNLSTLHMDLNKIEVIDEKILNPYQLPKTLRFFTLSGNRLTVGKYLNNLLNAVGITDLDISRQYLVYDPFVACHFDPDSCASEAASTTLSNWHNENNFKIIIVPPDLERIIWSKSVLYSSPVPSLRVFGGGKLRDMDLSSNALSQWIGQVVGLGNLTKLDLSDNGCTNMSHDFFANFPSLKELDISGNKLTRSLNPNMTIHAEKSFEKLINLTSLDLSGNEITDLPKMIFQKLSSIEILKLHRNEIQSIDVILNESSCLNLLDLSSNKLTLLPEPLTNALDNMVDRCNSNVEVRLRDNPIGCACSNAGFLQWMLNTKVNVSIDIHCELDDGTKLIINGKAGLKIFIQHQNSRCRDLTVVIVLCAAVLATLTTLIVCRILYRYRWKLRYSYYNRNRRHHNMGFERLFDNNAFVSYATSKCSFVKNELVPNLEDAFRLRVWVADRNSRPGVGKAENIVHAIGNSRKTVLLIDKAFLEDPMCDYEMNMARMESIQSKRAVIVFVLFDQISLCDLPPSIFKCLTDEECLKYPSNPNTGCFEEFWKKLYNAIVS